MDTNGSEITLSELLMSKTAFDQWIERHAGLPLRVKTVGFYTGMQLGSALGLGIRRLRDRGARERRVGTQVRYPKLR
jgi:hypothetical protein